MIPGIHISPEIFANDILTALKSSLEHDRKHVLRLLQLYGDQALNFDITFLKVGQKLTELRELEDKHAVNHETREIF